MSLEIERKYLDVDLEAAASRLRAEGATSLGARFETNIIFDRSGGELRERGELLRLRLSEWRYKTEARLTYKGVALAAEDPTLKAREELEVVVSDFAATKAMLERLGYATAAVYEKKREEWRYSLASGSRVTVDLDEVPFCRAVELEGEKADIDAAARRLGLDKYQSSAKTYHDLHWDWLLARGEEARPGFVFEPAIRARLRTLLDPKI